MELMDVSHHRSRKRIKDYGEVFTPEKYVHQMLDMLDKSVWADENVVFFEPTCGHGNFVAAVVRKRLEAFYKKVARKKSKNPHRHAMAHTLDNLWAIDIDRKNIEFCRSRVWMEMISFFEGYEPLDFSKNNEFWAHVLCCIKWQIHENEMLSGLEEDRARAEKSAEQTAMSRQWFSQNGHHPIDFDLSWCEYFKSLKENNVHSIEYSRGLKFIKALNGRVRKGTFEDFAFANPNIYGRKVA